MTREDGLVGAICDRQTGCPEHAGRDVVRKCRRTCQHADRQHLRGPVHARDADAVVGVGGDQATDECAGPAARFAGDTGTTLAVAGRVAGVRPVVVAPVAVVGPVGIGDEVVTRQEPIGEFRVDGHTCVDDGYRVG